MASNQRIDDLITEKAFQQLDRLLEKLGIAVSRFDEMSRSATQANNAVANSQGFRQLNTTVPQAATNLTNMAAAEQQVVTATRAVEAETASVVTVLNQFGGTLDQNVRRQVELKRELAGVRQQLKDLERQFAGSSASQARLAQTTSGLTRREVELKEALRQNSVAIRQQLRDNLAAGSSSDQLAARLDSLRRVYRSLSAEERANAQVGGVLRTSIAQTNAQITALDSTQGVYSRNVGNYLRSAFGGLRQLAYILPGIGIAGIFNLLIEGVTSLYEQITRGGNALNFFKERLNDLNAVYRTANKDAAEQIVKLRILYSAATDVTNSTVERTRAAKELQKTFPDSFKNSTTTAILNGQESATFRQLSKDILENAKARAAAGRLVEIENKILDIQFQRDKINFAKSNELRRVNGNVSASAGTGSGATTDVQLQKINITVRANLAQAELNQQEKILQQQADFLTRYVGGNSKIAAAITEGSTGGSGNRQSAFNDRLAIEKQNLEAILNNEQSSLDDRLKAINTFEVNSLAIISSGERQKVFTTLESTRLRKGIENDANKEIIKVNSDAQKELQRLFKEGLDAEKAIYDNSKSVQEQYLSQRLQAVQDDANDSLQALSDQYAQGLINTKQYQDQKADIERQASLDSIQVQIEAIQLLINIQKELGIDTSNAEKDLANLRRKLSKDTTNSIISDVEREAEARKKQNDAAKALAQEAAEFGFDLLTRGGEIEKNRLQAEADQIDINKDKETEAVQRSIGSEQEKADRINIINARAQAQKDALAARQRQIDQRQSQFEKLRNIASIIQNTATAVTAALPNIPLSVLIGALGAVQLARVLATPIPKYKDGVRNKSYGSLSIYGEAGQEYIKEPGKPGYFTSGATLGYLPAGTDVISNKELMAAMAKPEAVQYVGGQKVDLSQLTGEMRLTRKAIQGQKINTTVITKKGAVRQQQRIDQVNAYKASRFK